MLVRQPDSVRYYEFETLSPGEITHAVFTRLGGVSQNPWAELNLGGTVGDAPEHVAENRRRAFRAVGSDIMSLYDVWQVHSADVVQVDAPRLPHEAHRLADAMITNRPQVTLLMRFADCVPILLYDPVKRAVGLVHAGWQGTVKKVITQTITAMQQAFGTLPEDLLAGIGPSIGPDHYQIGADVISQVQASFGADADEVLRDFEGSVRLDLWLANRILLERCGVRQIEVAEICTACHTEEWFSHRGEHGKTGRFGSIIALKK